MEAKTRYSVIDLNFLPLSEDDYISLSDFSCGVKELDDFFHNEMELCAKYRYLIPYKCILLETGEIVGLFTLANDIENLEYEDRIDFSCIPAEYSEIFLRQTTYPAVNIGHLAVKSGYQSKGIGQCILSFVIATFNTQKATGCQFITVDALNNARTLNFYQNSFGFQFQSLYDLGKHSRRMYFPLIPIEEP